MNNFLENISKYKEKMQILVVNSRNCKILYFFIRTEKQIYVDSNSRKIRKNNFPELPSIENAYGWDLNQLINS